MINTVTYYLHYDIDDNQNIIIKNELFEEMLINIMNRYCELKITLIDRFGIANSKMDDIINEFVKDCKQNDRHRYCPYMFNDDFIQFPAMLKSFTEGLIKEFNTIHARNFEVFNNKARIYFKVSMPDEYISEEKKEEYLSLGANELFAETISNKVIVENVLPAFYNYLYKENRLSDKSDETNLFMYKIGLN